MKQKSRKQLPKKAAKKTAKKAAPIKKGVKKAVKKAAIKRLSRRAMLREELPKKAAKNSNFTKLKRDKMYRGSLVVKSADYVKDYILLVGFSDGSKKEVDFSTFLNDTPVYYFHKYRELDNFKKFKIEEGNVVWGKDWDLIFPVIQLYNGKILP